MKIKNNFLLKKPLFKLSIAYLLTNCTPVPQTAGQPSEAEFNKMATEMASGKVQEITIDQVRQKLAEVVLLDTREREEYEVSHITNARWVGYDDFRLERIHNLPKDTTIVLYCSVGYRSERIGEQLQKEGYDRVYNLYGSLFKWVNEGHPVVDGGGRQTEKVHGYDKNWSKWLKRGEIVY